MDIYYIIPIGSILSVLFIALVIGVYCIWSAVNNNQTIITDFAAEHSEAVLRVFFIIAVVLGLIITLIRLICYLSCDQDKESQFSMDRLPKAVLIPIKLFEYLLRLAGFSLPVFFSLSLCYGFLIDWSNDLMRLLSDYVVITLIMSPVFLFGLIIQLVVGLLPLMLMIPTFVSFEIEHNAFAFIISMLFAYGIGLILIIGYHHFILNHTTLISFLPYFQ